MHRTGARTTRRADAEQNMARILDAAATCLSRSPTASMGEIAQAAGVGRVTVYGHFPSREALIEATLTRLLDRGEAVLAGLDLTGDPRQALRTLIESSWRLIADAGAVLEAAQEELPPGRIRELHAKPAQRVEELIRRGQAEGDFRTDLPASWLVSVLYHVLKGAAADVSGGRLDPSDAPHFIVATVLAAYANAEKSYVPVALPRGGGGLPRASDCRGASGSSGIAGS
jgi:TetR/AcrR family transcriptional repressor of mexCD-oprJ operon